ncbi:hypothetical protein D0T12_03070 [Actinomadura spongiicola]|uniref:DDE Tnp4 domain-containing protein n=1 Tax=Actinomadura spongiicola TaxID=2303421 RepID=A0A372GPB6_9ACTN|nr:hypothetical protein D0T12_03070 [Actinomadura spongiicola]
MASPDGTIVWVSGPLPGSVHDLKAARIWGLVRAPAAAGFLVLADKGYVSADPHVKTPCKGKDKPEPLKDANRSHANSADRANERTRSRRAGRS